MPITYEQVFSKSVEKVITAQKKPTEARCWLFDEAGTINLEGSTQWVNTKITIRVAVYEKLNGLTSISKPLNIYHRVDTGAWTKIATVTPTVPPGSYDYKYTLDSAGTHSFYSEFAGDATHAGCSAIASLSARR